MIEPHRGETERGLLIAVLRRAVADLTEPVPIRTEARRWLTDGRTDAFSFVWTCAHLGLAADTLRERLLQDSAEMLEVLER